MWFLYLLAVVCTETIVELVIKSQIFKPIRDAAKGMKVSFFGELLSCGYCFSMWAAVLVTVIIFWGNETGIPFLPKVIQLIIITLFIHRLSNLFHNVMDRIDKFYRRKCLEVLNERQN